MKNGYHPTIFCANTIHNSDEVINVSNEVFKKGSIDGIPYVFIKTPHYLGDGKQRIKNMLIF